MQSQASSKLLRVGNLTRYIRRGMSETKPEAVKSTPEPSYVPPSQSLADVHKVNSLERYFLVWTKKYKNVKDVPAYVTRDTMERSRNIMRIRINLALIFLALMGSFTASQLGRRAAREGQSVQKMNEDWHKAYNEARKAEEAKAE